MSFEVSWYIPRRVLSVCIKSELELSDVENMAEVVRDFLGEGEAPIHIILDDAKGGRPPLSLKALKARLSVIEQPGIGWIVGVGDSDMVAKFLVPMLFQVMRLNYTRVPSIEQAIDFIKKHDIALQHAV